jgi:hypothetical protein
MAETSKGHIASTSDSGESPHEVLERAGVGGEGSATSGGCLSPTIAGTTTLEQL